LPSARRLDGRPTIREVERYRNLRPDAVVVNPSLKKVAIMDLTRPFDGQDRDDDQPRLPTQPRAETLNCERPESPHGVDDAASRTGSSEGLQGTSHTASASTHGRSRITAAVLRKLSAYGGLAEAVRQLKGGDEWQVEVLPWVVGIKGVVDATGIYTALDFLEVPANRRWKILQRTALASVESFQFMHRVRVSANPRSLPLDGAPSVVEAHSHKRRLEEEDVACTLQRWRRLSRDSMRTNLLATRWRGGREPQT